ncbi:Putative transglutaminase-like cysteine proteinase [Hyphomicrobiales bacterium]|nr:Putative transglutaminase-like cysteine proteinase [Hyphomicrobiales bacterium]CAH1666984.1 putative transglutaminase-like cysteine proteinase [Hyphomicrobiales bacterium]
MAFTLRVVAFFASLCAAATSQAMAQSRQASLPNFPITPIALEMGNARAPLGWADFCRKNSVDCDVADGQAKEVMITPRSWNLLLGINAKVNKEIEPVSDMDHWGVVESWDYPTDGKGDCEDYVLEKRRRLIKAGLPREALLVTVVRDMEDEGHAVLTVRTDIGDLVLDNKRQQILPWTATGYRYLKRQSATNPNLWVSLGAPDSTTATAAR